MIGRQAPATVRSAVSVSAAPCLSTSFYEQAADKLTKRRSESRQSRTAYGRPREWTIALVALLLLTLLRLTGQYFSQVDLFYDEAQYWAWSQRLAFGYFSKPPLLAWFLTLSNSACGTTEACVRSCAPLFYLASSIVTYAVARRLYGRRVALWSALTLALVPGVSFSSRIVSTDVPLVFFWALALLAYVNLLQSKSRLWSPVLGVSLGLGFLSKYAMLYFLPGIALCAIIDLRARHLLRDARLWAALAVAGLLILPNVFWNVQNDFVTLKQTRDNVTGDGLGFSLLGALEFFGSQFGVFGPLLFGAFLGVIVTIRASDVKIEDRLLVCFALPPLVLVTCLGFLKPVNANWAAIAGVSLSVVTCSILLRRKHRFLLHGSLAIGIVVQVALLVGDVMPYRLGLLGIGEASDFYHRTLGWRSLGQETAALAGRFGAKSIVSEGRHEVASLIYYLRGSAIPLYSWPRRDGPSHEFDISHPVQERLAEPALFITPCPFDARLREYFANVQDLGAITIKTGPSSVRRYNGFLLSTQVHPVGPIRDCVR